MNKNTLSFIVIIVLLIAGAVIGVYYYQSKYGEFRQQLLVNESEKAYIYQLTPEQTIPDGYRSVGAVEDFSEEQFKKEVDGLIFGGSGEEPLSAAVFLPKEDEQPAWIAALETLSPNQKNLCASLPEGDAVFYCLVRHLVLNALENDQTAEICDPIYQEDYQNECIRNINEHALNLVPDENQNGLIDLFENNGLETTGK